MISRRGNVSLLAAVWLVACAPAGMPGGEVDHGPLGPGGKEDRWDWRNRPERFDGELVFDLESLPRSGRAEQQVWPSTYWPTYEDSINHRWNGSRELSPAEKYDKAFNGWEPPEGFMDLRPFSRYRPTPEEQWDPAYYEQLGPLAKWVSDNLGNRRDREAAVEAGGVPEEEWPIETWWGICHAWVPASMLEKRPLHPVTYNGVTFYPGDLEGLIIAAYDRTPAQMIGGRCNRGNGEDYQVERDEYGRAVNNECRDTNPGALHVILANYLGLQGRPFAEDKTYDYEVWNQPIVAFEVEKMEEITVEDAMKLLERSGDTYAYNEDAKQLFDVQVTVTYLSESEPATEPVNIAYYEQTDTYTYILEVDAEGRVIGGEYYGASRSSHPDFLWNPTRLRRSSIPHLDLEKVRMLIEMSRAPQEDDTAASGDEGAGSDGSDEGAIVERTSAPNLTIPDNDERGVSDRIEVRENGTVQQVQLVLDIAHSYRGDLRVSLSHGGVTKVVVDREGGGQDDVRGTFTVSGFEGMDVSGPWTLTVSDGAPLDTGTLEQWSLRITTASR